MNHLGAILLLVVVSYASSQFTFTRTSPFKKLTSVFDQPRSNFNRGQSRYQSNPNIEGQYNPGSSDYYSSRYNGQYRSQESGEYVPNNDHYSNDNSGKYIPDDSGRYIHIDSKYQHTDVAGLGYRHQDGNIEKYRPENSGDGYKGDFEKYKGDGGYKGYRDNYDVDGYKGDNEKYKGDGGYKGYHDKFDVDAYKGNKDKQVPYKNNNNNLGDGGLFNRNNGPNSGNNNKASGSGNRGINSGIDGKGTQGAGTTRVNTFSAIGNEKNNAGFGDGGLLNNEGNTNANRNAQSKRGSDICNTNGPRNFKIIRQKSDLGIDQYHYLYETENCMYKEEEGAHVQVNNEETLRAEGLYYYVAPDNVKYTTTYTADERGYLPQGDHIPEMPPLILKGLQYLKSIGKL